MRAKFTLLAIMMVALFSAQAQQLPNASFDTWTSELAPDGWATYESYFHGPLGHSERDSVDYVLGTNSIKVMTDTVPGFAAYGVLAGVVALGKGVGNGQPAFSGMPFTFRPDTMYVVYKYTSLQADTPLVYLRLTNAGTSVIGHPTYGVQFYLQPSTQWVTGGGVLSSFYTGATVPDTLKLEIYSSKDPSPNGGTMGSVLHLDNVLFSYVALPNGLQEVADKMNIRLFPNPTTDAVNITTAQNADGFKAYIFDLNGRVVAGAELSGVVTSINVASLANGTYVCRIADKDGNVLKNERVVVAK